MLTIPMLFLLAISPILATCKTTQKPTVIPGGWVNNNPNDVQILNIAKQSLTLLGKSPNGLKIVNSRSQVVSGIKYDIKLTYAQGGNSVHELVVVSQPWNKQKPLDVISFN
ncbi:hypothetical protein L596_028572 [Steinernema carpocapsae]|uniref:Cystatin domain-containing protein n=1 Tax=Steinernema carpocapsae TaxID=34508 RepID=A0A4U5LYT0_STECR|nr:hypothetical protein L596_028572 [Steinernema carpocapsae]